MLERFYRLNQVAGVSIFIDGDGTPKISICGISINGDDLDIAYKAENLAGLERLKDVLPDKALVSLNISGRGILYKNVDRQTDITAINFSQILPNATLGDFYIQNFLSGGSSFVAVIRKEEADKWIMQLTSLGFKPLMLSLGPFPVQNVLPQLNFYDSTIIFNGYVIQRNELGEWLSWTQDNSAFAKFPVKVQSEIIGESLLIPYAAAFQLAVSDRLQPVSAPSDTLDDNLENILQERKLKAQSFLVLMVAFMLLLINFAVYSWLNSSNSRLVERVGQSTQSSEDLKKISDEVANKEALLNLLGWEANINKSSLIDQVASLLPSELTWQEAAIDPVDLAASRQQKTIVFSNRKIRITGTSEKIIPVNEWIARIKTRPWVKNVQLDSYSFNSELNTGQFTVIIDY